MAACVCALKFVCFAFSRQQPKKKHFKYISCEGKKNRMNCLSKMATVAEQLDEVNRVRVSVHAISLSILGASA